ncbi:MAG: YedE-related selenium metabolism membrane protein [Deltaproteobacteria bacterium]|nr:MAG: YedE-related selenium metabolism membrane protein [Deltaproteobacteria bacterium]
MRNIIRQLIYPENFASVLFLGLAFGVLAVLLSIAGNPTNTGLCVSCFLVNIAGALGLHGALVSSYLRPEIFAIVVGSFAVAFLTGEFRARTSGGNILKFLGGAFMIFGCEVFIGCPVKMLLRLSSGSLTALVGLAGLFGGVAFASLFVREGFHVFKYGESSEMLGTLLPLGSFLALFLSSTGVYAFAAGVVGSSARHAPFALSLGAGLLMGFIGQRTRFCITGSVEKSLLTRTFTEAGAPVGFLLGALLLNLVSGGFHPAYFLEPGAHTNLFWAFLSLAMVGFGAILIGGCPFRQLVLAGEGDLGAAWASAGMLAGAALAVRMGISSSAGGVTLPGKISVLLGFVFFLSLALWGMKTKRGRAGA